MNTNSAPELFEYLFKQYPNQNHAPRTFTQPGFNEHYNILTLTIDTDTELPVGLSFGKNTVTLFSTDLFSAKSFEKVPEVLKIVWDKNCIRVFCTITYIYPVDEFCKKICDAVYAAVHAKNIKDASLKNYAAIENEFWH